MEESYRKVLSELRLFDEADINELESFIKAPKNQEILSRKFIASILEISRNNLGYKSENLLTKAVLSEIERLNTRIASFKNNQLERAKKIDSLMEVEKIFNELELNVEKKTIIFESLKDNLNIMMIQSGLDVLENPKLLSKAVPALVQPILIKKRFSF